jgi:hypothetical protein
MLRQYVDQNKYVPQTNSSLPPEDQQPPPGCGPHSLRTSGLNPLDGVKTEFLAFKSVVLLFDYMLHILYLEYPYVSDWCYFIEDIYWCLLMYG